MKGNLSDFWTVERVETLRAQWAMGRSVKSIADLIGATRNQVIGKAHRLELPMHTASSHSPDRVRTKRPRQPYKRKTPFGVPRIFEFKVLPEPPAHAPDALNVAFADLDNLHCRYPTKDHPLLFCGATIEDDSSYCAYHHALCHTKATGREDRTRKPHLNPFRRAA